VNGADHLGLSDCSDKKNWRKAKSQVVFEWEETSTYYSSTGNFSSTHTDTVLIAVNLELPYCCEKGAIKGAIKTGRVEVVKLLKDGGTVIKDAMQVGLGWKMAGFGISDKNAIKLDPIPTIAQLKCPPHRPLGNRERHEYEVIRGRETKAHIEAFIFTVGTDWFRERERKPAKFFLSCCCDKKDGKYK
jgi:hypothetical protein